jgi:hypothetical protein
MLFRKNFARPLEDSLASLSEVRAAAINGDLADNLVVSIGEGVKRSIVALKLKVVGQLAGLIFILRFFLLI